MFVSDSPPFTYRWNPKKKKKKKKMKFISFISNLFQLRQNYGNIKVNMDCLWKQRKTHKITKIGDLVALSLSLCNTVVCEAAYTP